MNAYVRAWRKMQLFYDLTTIGDAECSVFIIRLAIWKVCILQSTVCTIYNNKLGRKKTVSHWNGWSPLQQCCAVLWSSSKILHMFTMKI